MLGEILCACKTNIKDMYYGKKFPDQICWKISSICKIERHRNLIFVYTFLLNGIPQNIESFLFQ